MTAAQDKAGDIGIDVAESLCRDAVTREVCRGVCRLLRDLGYACIAELPLPNGRRADVVGLSQSGEFWIVEVKSNVEDFRADHKWPEYRDFSDALFFAVAPGFPLDLLPPTPASSSPTATAARSCAPPPRRGWRRPAARP